MNKIACYRPWNSYYVENSNQAVKPCCWVNKPLATLNDDSNLENSYQTEEWEEMRRDMYNANGELPSQCPIYCQQKQDHEWYHKTYNTLVSTYINENRKWDLAPVEFSATIANACNLKCKMCWIFDDFDYVISEKGLNRVLEDIKLLTPNNKENNIPDELSINIVGGEVFYAKPLRNILYNLINDENVGKTFKFNFITNATIWDQKFWDIMVEKPNALNCMTISIDGYDKKSYLDIRGVDSFDKVMENLDKIIEWRNNHSETHGYWSININSLIQTNTYKHFKEIIDLFMERDTILSFIPLVISYKPNAEWQCYNLPEHQIPCLDAIKEAIIYINTFKYDDAPETGEDIYWFKKQQQQSIKESLERNQQYLESIINNNSK